MTLLLEPMVSRLQAQADLRPTLDLAVRDVVALHGGEFGDIQLRMPDGALVLVGHAGLPRAFLEAFLRCGPQDGTVCARAISEGRIVTVEDITRDANFAPWLASTRSAPFRSVLSAPLITTDGRAVGVVSAHFAHEYRPTAVEVASLEAYCRALADRLELLLAGLDVEDVAARLSRDMLAAAG